MERLLWYLFAGSRGGPTRIRIVATILQGPQNANQLAKSLSLDYKTVEYNLRLLTKHLVLVADRPGAYGALYYPSKNFQAHQSSFDAILAAGRPASAVHEAPASNWGKPEIESNQR